MRLKVHDRQFANFPLRKILKPMKKIVIPIVLLLIVAGGYFAYRAFSGPYVAPRLADLPPAEQSVRRAEADKLVREVDKIAGAARKNERSQFEVSATQDQLNTLLQDKLKVDKLPVRDLSAQLQPDSLVLSGRAKYNGIEVPVVINGDLQARDGGLQLQIQSLTLGGFGAPDEWKNKAQRAASEAIEKALSGGQKVRFESVEIGDEKLTVRGQTG